MLVISTDVNLLAYSCDVWFWFSFDNPPQLILLLYPAAPQMVVKTYMDMDQDSEEEKQQYLGLALHLASEFFLRNPNKDVRLLVACCLADIFRIYAPEAPYTSHDKLKVWNKFRTAASHQAQARGNRIQHQSSV